MSVWREIEDLLDRYGASVRIEYASESAWSAELRLALTHPLNTPSQSIVFSTTAASSPSGAARALLDAADEWMRESGVEPVPAPAWMRPEE